MIKIEVFKGGRLGPYLDPGLPDLRNFVVKSFECNSNDTIIVVSDGVDDNFGNKIIIIIL